MNVEVSLQDVTRGKNSFNGAGRLKTTRRLQGLMGDRGLAEHNKPQTHTAQSPLKVCAFCLGPMG